MVEILLRYSCLGWWSWDIQRRYARGRRWRWQGMFSPQGITNNPPVTYQRFSRFAGLFKGKSEVLRFDLDGLFSVLSNFISLVCRQVRITIHPINLFFSFGPTFLRSLPLFLFSGKAWEMIFNFSSTLFPWSNMVIFTSAMVDSTLTDSTFLLMLFWTTKEEEAVGKIFWVRAPLGCHL